ncbi:MAG: ACT domain-containing protein [Limnochordales bacterium]|nr:ACT domain-containing protein [Limnochordales bacterium]
MEVENKQTSELLRLIGRELSDAESGPPGTARQADDRVVVVVLGRDRIGIIATITSVLARHSVNILDINQTIFGELFSMTLIGDLSRADVPFGELKAELVRAGEELGVQVLAQKEAVFHRMHRP